jgi:uncharacterized membrane protein HdeD (DUF308 family)
MTASERAQMLFTARLLQAAEKIDWLSTGLTLLAAAAIVFGTPHPAAAIASMALGLVAKVYGVRVAIDARLFRDLAEERLTLATLDAALGAMSLAPAGRAERPLLDRCRGARRLVAFLAAATIAQGAALVLSALGSP